MVSGRDGRLLTTSAGTLNTQRCRGGGGCCWLRPSVWLSGAWDRLGAWTGTAGVVSRLVADRSLFLNVVTDYVYT